MTMLWYKGWLETRWRILMPLAMILFSFFQAHSKARLQLTDYRLLAVMPLFWVIAPALLAGSGILTEAPFRAVKGSEGSLYFTLSLPVSRLRLLAWRAAVGMLETVGYVLAVCCVLSIAFPEIPRQIPLADGIRYAVTVVLCCLPVYGLSTLFATFLGQQWQVLATMIVIFLVRGIEGAMGGGGLLFRAMGEASPLVTHAMPWVAVCASVGLGLAFFLAALKVVESRQY